VAAGRPELRAVLAEPLKRVVDLVHGEHDT
jgi:hypothetical protein